jgi:hypothetical protein
VGVARTTRRHRVLEQRRVGLAGRGEEGLARHEADDDVLAAREVHDEVGPDGATVAGRQRGLLGEVDAVQHPGVLRDAVALEGRDPGLDALQARGDGRDGAGQGVPGADAFLEVGDPGPQQVPSGAQRGGLGCGAGAVHPAGEEHAHDDPGQQAEDEGEQQSGDVRGSDCASRLRRGRSPRVAGPLRVSWSAQPGDLGRPGRPVCERVRAGEGGASGGGRGRGASPAAQAVGECLWRSCASLHHRRARPRAAPGPCRGGRSSRYSDVT